MGNKLNKSQNPKKIGNTIIPYVKPELIQVL